VLADSAHSRKRPRKVGRSPTAADDRVRCVELTIGPTAAAPAFAQNEQRVRPRWRGCFLGRSSHHVASRDRAAHDCFRTGAATLAIRTSALRLCNRATRSGRPIRLLSAPCPGRPASTLTVARAREQASTTPTTSLPSWNDSAHVAGSARSHGPDARIRSNWRVSFWPPRTSPCSDASSSLATTTRRPVLVLCGHLVAHQRDDPNHVKAVGRSAQISGGLCSRWVEASESVAGGAAVW
jgi:hypothetical protein